MAQRIVMVGLGATGVAMAQSLLQRADVEIVGAADRNPAVIGTDLGALAGSAANGVTVVDDPAGLPPAELAIVATTSDLNHVADTIVSLLERSYNVMSICEELAYPWSSHPEIARRLDDTAKAHDVTVLGTGANPGVLMDTLPLLLTTLSQRVDRVIIRRRTNMSRYGAILSKFGMGLTPEQFSAAQASGAVVGHYGFEQSISALASGLGWTLDTIEVAQVRPAMVSEIRRVGRHITIEPGQIAAVTHAARGLCGGRAVIDLTSPTGFESFVSTIAAAVNVATAVIGAPSGLLSMGDLPVRALASKTVRLEGCNMHRPPV
ncbi:dihydrodipicolinate reductase [Mycobacterium sp. 852013-50091_SCH5140682]|uniref:dihydrodipicolinate reductase n=1 Tax=Mycobacterium sp. 852013-50091_SCH5140682 TaxID=1834109 RepID=UPI0007EC09C4|nr:dihydrodipicolinate reductase [Mycobacterium sp. 852013-50091_SCH5140682]OBC12635.1 dihydrodipicolinate reductase [Mycobacterium sp. 852013-50091_SCH5140682]